MVIIYDKVMRGFRAYGDAVTAARVEGYPVELLRIAKVSAYEDNRILVGHCDLVKGIKRGDNPKKGDNLMRGVEKKKSSKG